MDEISKNQYSRKLANGSLEEYLKANKIVSIEGVDTRALVAHIRTKGRYELYHFF